MTQLLYYVCCDLVLRYKKNHCSVDQQLEIYSYCIVVNMYTLVILPIIFLANSMVSQYSPLATEHSFQYCIFKKVFSLHTTMICTVYNIIHRKSAWQHFQWLTNIVINNTVRWILFLCAMLWYDNVCPVSSHRTEEVTEIAEILF
jgi:hypothetical protein